MLGPEFEHHRTSDCCDIEQELTASSRTAQDKERLREVLPTTPEDNDAAATKTGGTAAVEDGAAEIAEDEAAAAVESSPWDINSDPSTRVTTPLLITKHLQPGAVAEAAGIASTLAIQMRDTGAAGCAAVLHKLADRIKATSNTKEEVEGTSLAVRAVQDMMLARGLVREASVLGQVWDEASGESMWRCHSSATNCVAGLLSCCLQCAQCFSLTSRDALVSIVAVTPNVTGTPSSDAKQLQIVFKRTGAQRKPNSGNPNSLITGSQASR